MITYPAPQRRPTHPSFPSLAAGLLAVALTGACGPVGIGVGVASAGGGGSTTVNEVPLSLAAESAAVAIADPCGLLQSLVLTVNRDGVRLTYQLNGGSEQGFTDPRTGDPEPELAADVAGTRTVLLRPGANTLVVRATSGADVAERTFTLDRSGVDPVVLELEPIAVEDTVLDVTWSVPASADEQFFWIHFGAAPGRLDDLTGTTAAGAASPRRIEASALTPFVRGSRRYYTTSIGPFAAGPDGTLAPVFVGVRTNDGCETPVVAAHTRPAAAEGRWTAITEAPYLPMACDGGMPPPPPAPPVGGRDSAANVVGMPPLLVDRGADETTASTRITADGIPELVTVARSGLVVVHENQGSAAGGFAMPVLVDDLDDAPLPCNGSGASTGTPIRALTRDQDGDGRPDLFVLTPQRIWYFDGDDTSEQLSNTPTPGACRLLNFKKKCTSFVELTSATGWQPGDQFLDFGLGDFDGDGTVDIAATIGAPQTLGSSGLARSLHVWYSNKDGDGFTRGDWPARAPLTVAINSAFGDDGMFVTGDLDGDGRDDIVGFEHTSSNVGRYQVRLNAGRGAMPLLLTSGDVDAREENARWDQTALADADGDGYLDLVSVRADDLGPTLGAVTRALVYRIVPGLGVDTANPLLDLGLNGRSEGRQRGHLIVADADGDGLQDLVYRSVFTANAGVPFEESVVSISRGRRNRTTGRQDWTSFDPGAVRINLPLDPTQEVPHVHGAAGDLDADGTLDLIVVHERSAPPHAAVVARGEPRFAFERSAAPLLAADLPFAGSLRPAAPASLAVPIDGGRGLVIDIEQNGVRMLPANRDRRGLPSGGFEAATALAFPTPLSAPILEVAAGEEAPGDIVALLDGGGLASIRIREGAATAVEGGGITIQGPARIFAARLDLDRTTDAVIWDGGQNVYLASTIDATGQRNQALRVVDQRTLAAVPEFVHVADTEDGPFSEVIAVLPGAAPGAARSVEIWKVTQADGTGVPFFRAPGFANPVTSTIDAEVVSMTVADPVGRTGVNPGRAKWLVTGTADGRVLFLERDGFGGLSPATARAGIDATPGSRVQVIAGDVDFDTIDDLLVYEEGATELRVYRNQPDDSQPWRFPNPGSFQFQGTGSFDAALVVPLPVPIAELRLAQLNDDPVADLLLRSADGSRLLIYHGRAAQSSR